MDPAQKSWRQVVKAAKKLKGFLILEDEQAYMK